MVLSAAERQRRYRARVRAGRVVVSIDVDQALLEDALVGGGFLAPADVDDQKLSAAASRAVEAWAFRQLVDGNA